MSEGKKIISGQRLRKGSIGAWQRVSPYLGGIGLASAVVSLNVALYYNTVIAWCLYYFGKVFSVSLFPSLSDAFTLVFTELSMATSLVRMPQNPLPK